MGGAGMWRALVAREPFSALLLHCVVWVREVLLLLCERACLVNMHSAGDDAAILKLERYSYVHPGSVWVGETASLPLWPPHE